MADAIASVNRLGLPVVVVTNQSGVGRGLFDWSAFEAVNDAINAQLAQHGAHLDAVFACGESGLGGRVPTPMTGATGASPAPACFSPRATCLRPTWRDPASSATASPICGPASMPASAAAGW